MSRAPVKDTPVYDILADDYGILKIIVRTAYFYFEYMNTQLVWIKWLYI